MKETNAIITSVRWTGKNPKEIERFCHKMELDFFFTEGSLYLPSYVEDGSLIEAIKGYGVIKLQFADALSFVKNIAMEDLI